MNSKNITKYLIACSLCCGGAAAFDGCADWDDHYDANSELLDTQQSTLWENIANTDNLSQFASLLKKVDYDAVLNASQTYTVWAPVNGSFDYETLNAFSDERLRREFIENHIARSNYPASGVLDNLPIYTLNEKLAHFNGDLYYDMQGISVVRPNLASENGTIHLLGGKIPFVQNIYESLNANEFPIDSISNFYHSYDVKKLNEYKSVQGPTVNGEITYLDSVFDEHNDLFADYYAYINREDSNYSMIIPTNDAWTKAKEKVSQYFHYVPSFEFIEDLATKLKTKVEIADVQYLQDSMVNRMLTANLYYNNNLYDNKKLKTLNTGETLQCDSLYSTLRRKVYSEDAASLLHGATRYTCSNGIAWITDSLRMQPWLFWNPEIVVEGETSQYLANTNNVYEPVQRVTVVGENQNPEISGRLSKDVYLEAQPASSNVNPEVDYYLPDVRSTTYSIYIVIVPPHITSTVGTNKPNRFSVSMGYADASGINDDSNRKWVAESNFVSDTTKIDTIYLGDFTFPMAYAGTGNYYPYLRVSSSVTNRDRLNYDRTLRIDCIILRPKELDDYLKEYPDYKYDKGE